MNKFEVREYVASLTDEELCAEVLSWEFSSKATDEELLTFVKKNKVTSFYAANLTLEKIEFLKKAIKENSKTPCLVTSDIECVPGFCPELKRYSVGMMNLGAAKDSNLSFELGKYVARVSRAHGMHLNLSPVVDININPNNPVINVRASGDTVEAVMCAAVNYGKGMRSEGKLAIAPKHFPGDGVDDRNQHFCTTVNSLSKEDWMNSFGKIYKQLIEDGTEAIMVSHVSLPFYDPTEDECGNMPASLSKPIMTDLLKGELGFDGCIISDAMSMIGTAARCPIDKLSIEFLRAGGDLILFPEKEDYDRILEALRSGYLERERLVDAVERVMMLKAKLGLFEDREDTLCESDVQRVKELLCEVSRKSITLVRNVDDVLPMSIKKGEKILVVTLSPEKKDYDGDDFPALADELESRGYEVIRMTNPSHYRVDAVIESVSAVFIGAYINTMNCSGSSMRLGWNNLMTFWRAYIFKCKKVVFVSFGDPYKLIELPFLKTYVNSYSKSPEVIRATVSACFGEEPFEGITPVNAEGK